MTIHFKLKKIFKSHCTMSSTLNRHKRGKILDFFSLKLNVKTTFHYFKNHPLK